MKIIRGVLYFINIIVVVVTVLSYITPYVDPSRFWFFSFFGLVFPILLLLNVSFVIIWLFSIKKKALISILVLVLGYQNILKTVSFHLNNDEDKGISILSYNLNQGGYLYHNKIKKGVLGKYLNNQNVDLLLIQESNSSRIRKELKFAKNYNYKFVDVKIGTSILSKYPIINKGMVDFNLNWNTNSCIWVDIVSNKDTIRVFNVHFQSNKISKQADDIVKDIEKDQAIDSKDVKIILKRYKSNVQVRANQVKRVKAELLKSPYPIILGGDFNDPSMTYTYQQFSELLKDSFKEKGFGLGMSYAGSIPFLRIDFIFVSNEIKVLDYETLDDKYSDHFAIKAEFAK